MRRIRSPIKQKVLLLLGAGLILGLSRSPKKHGYVIHQVAKAWRGIDRQYLYRLLREFREERLVEWREEPNGLIKVVISEKGNLIRHTFDFDGLKIRKPIRWDGRWRVIFFDIPEKRRPARDALRRKLQELGFYEWQKSVLVHPFPCHDELNFLIEFFEIRPYTRQAELVNPTNEAELKLHFNL